MLQKNFVIVLLYFTYSLFFRNLALLLLNSCCCFLPQKSAKAPSGVETAVGNLLRVRQLSDRSGTLVRDSSEVPDDATDDDPPGASVRRQSTGLHRRGHARPVSTEQPPGDGPRLQEASASCSGHESKE